MSENITYTSPEENLERGHLPVHYFSIESEGKEIGKAEIRYYSRPFPHYVIEELQIFDQDEREKGYGSMALERIESFLSERRKAGIVVDGIADDNPARGMYERRGWSRLPGEDAVYAYNLPNSVDISTLQGEDSIYNKTAVIQQGHNKESDI
jgi:GNAT superfamily N-acetyltransferase